MALGTGAQIGPYEILSPLGAGGMGEVYRARDPRLDRAVAIKVLRSPQGASPTQLERFQREARSLARISHPHICTLHDVGEHGGVAYLVMELLEGETLADRLERGAIPLEQALTIAVQIAEALDALHKKGIVHRDLKPANVMLTSGGVKLLDFGLAKLRDKEYDSDLQPTQSLALTDQGSVLGTLPYMAPEQIEGHDVDARTDIFSFGVVVFEMITGRRPFAGDTRGTLIAAIVTAEPLSLASLQPATPRPLERLIARCLAKDVELRWQTARDLVTELRWIAEGGADARVMMPRSASRRWRGALAVALIAAVAVGALILGAARFAPTSSIGRFARVTFRHGGVSSARFTPDGKSFVYSASWDGTPYQIFLGRPGSPDARDLALESGRIASISASSDMAVIFGPQNIVQTFGPRTLGRVPMAGGARRDLFTGVVDADWIPGTDSLAIVRDPGAGRPWSVEFPAGNVVHEARAMWSLRVSPDGNRIAFFEGPGVFTTQPEASITVVERSGRTSTLTMNWSGFGLAWSASGKEVWFTATNGEDPPSLHAVTLAGVVRALYQGPDWMVLHDISTDGRALLSRNTVRISISCQPPGETVERDMGWRWGATARALSPDGRTMIFQEQLGNDLSSTEALVYRRDIDGSPAVRLGVGIPQSLSPDGKWVLAVQDGAFVLLPMGAGSVAKLAKGDLKQLGNGSWLADSHQVVFTGDSGGMPRGYVQEIPDGLPRAITPEGVVLPAKAAVRGDGTILARVGPAWRLYSLDGGDPRPVPALTARDVPLQWSADHRFLYVGVNLGAPPRSRNDVFRVDLTSGSRTLWKTLAPVDPVGVEFGAGSPVMTPDASAYCYSYTRRLGDLFVVDGLK
jgi:eukaryotic-like serine/threonine-protein kinase